MTAGNKFNIKGFEDFFQEIEEENITPTPTPQKKQQCCSDPQMILMDERTQMCQNCGTQMQNRIEDNLTEKEEGAVLQE